MYHRKNLDYKFKDKKYFGWFPGIHKDGKTFNVKPIGFLHGRYANDYDYKTTWYFARLSDNPLYYRFKTVKLYYIDVDRNVGYGLIGFIIEQDKYFVKLRMQTGNSWIKKFPRTKIVHISIGEKKTINYLDLF